MKRWMLVVAMAAAAYSTLTFAAGDPPDGVAARDLGSDRAVAGGAVVVGAPVPGDLLGAGGSIEVSAEVGGDALLAAGTVGVRAPIGQGLYATGGRVVLDAPVQRNVRAAGGSVEIGPAGNVVGNVAVAGGDVRIRGPIGGYVSAAGGRVLIDAPVGGDVDIGAGKIALGPRAAIGGRLRYTTGAELTRDPAARVAGGIERHEATAVDERRFRGGDDSVHWLWTAGLMVLAALLAAAAPAGHARALEALRARPWTSILVGMVALVVIPFAALVLFVTVIGAPLALVLLLAYPGLLLVGYVSVGVALGAVALGRLQPERMPRPGWRAAFAAAAVLAIGIATGLPWLGGIVALFVLLAGTGALLIALRQGLPARAATA